MWNVILWAIGTGLVSGGVWAGIVLSTRLQRLSAENRELLEDRQRYLDELEIVQRRVVELEDRLDFAERLLPGPDPSSRP